MTEYGVVVEALETRGRGKRENGKKDRPEPREKGVERQGNKDERCKRREGRTGWERVPVCVGPRPRPCTLVSGEGTSERVSTWVSELEVTKDYRKVDPVQLYKRFWLTPSTHVHLCRRMGPGRRGGKRGERRGRQRDREREGGSTGKRTKRETRTDTGTKIQRGRKEWYL